MLTVYGIPNCDTIKKTLTWLKANNIDFQFHDYKKDGISREKLENWLAQAEWNTLLNRAGTTFKQLSEEQKAAINDAASALEIMLNTPSSIKRPVIEQNGKVVKIGWKPEGL
jgi:arsenate reductase (glutaredoxin)